eukprot:15458968-Alexandrium_andersonii.AAC.1
MGEAHALHCLRRHVWGAPWRGHSACQAGRRPRSVPGFRGCPRQLIVRVASAPSVPMRGRAALTGCHSGRLRRGRHSRWDGYAPEAFRVARSAASSGKRVVWSRPKRPL